MKLVCRVLGVPLSHALSLLPERAVEMLLSVDQVKADAAN